MGATAGLVPGGPTNTDAGNAQRLVERHGASLRFCPAMKNWLFWDGRRWAVDTIGRAQELAKETSRSIYAVAAATEDDHDRRALSSHAKASESGPRITAMLRLATSYPKIVVRPEELDSPRTRYMLNVMNGTLDLEIGKLRPHCREDLITKLAPVAFDPSAKCPRWDAFLSRVQPDHEVSGFLRRYFGSALTGDTGDEQFVVAYGAGRNGKSTLIETLLAMLGEYGHKADSELFLAPNGHASQRGGPRPDLMALRGTRLVAVVEAAEGRRLDENLVKQLTGRDTITARRLFQDESSFTPEHKLFLASNYLPRIHGTDPAIWARVLLVRFEVAIPPEERDTTLKDRLVTPPELSGILNWALQGLREWHAVTTGSRLKPPDSVRAATRDYREDEDVLGPFLADRCVLGPEEWTSTKDLTVAYRSFCEATGMEELKDQPFRRRLRSADCKPEPNPDPRDRSRTRGWRGLRLRGASEGDPAAGTVGTVEDGSSDELPF